jgi:hypothetical protein
MSVLPLSAANAPESLTEPEAYEKPPGSFNSDKFDAIVGAIVDRMPDDDAPAAPKKDLDTLISEGLDKHEAAQADKESFERSKASREELNDRYGAQGDLSTTIDKYIQWAAHFRENPQEVGQRFAESYLSASPYALTPREPKEKPEAFIDGTGKRYNGKILDAIVESATDGSEQKDFVATAKQREALKVMFPGKTWDEALATIVRIDRDAYKDPLGTAATVAAAFGMPVTARQQEQAQQIAHLGNQIDQALPLMPGIENQQVQQRVLDILARDDFHRSGRIRPSARTRRCAKHSAAGAAGCLLGRFRVAKDAPRTGAGRGAHNFV